MQGLYKDVVLWFFITNKITIVLKCDTCDTKCNYIWKFAIICFQGIISLIVWGDEIRFGMIKSNKARREERELIGLILHDWYRYW